VNTSPGPRTPDCARTSLAIGPGSSTTRLSGITGGRMSKCRKMKSFKHENITTARTVANLASVQVLRASRKRLSCVRQRTNLTCRPRGRVHRKNGRFTVHFASRLIQPFQSDIPCHSAEECSLSSGCARAYLWISAIDLLVPRWWLAPPWHEYGLYRGFRGSENRMIVPSTG
jgi:hypothetical protein